jgi:hypothetical protein
MGDREADGEQELPRIEWGSAQVSERTLRVDLGGEAPKDWASRFRAVLSRLRHDGGEPWGEIKLARRRIEVADVAEGSEGDLRHLLESVVLQANTDLGLLESGPESVEPETPGEARDARMASAFRDFADAR